MTTRVWSALLVCAAMSTASFAQVFYGSIVGTVEDPSGAAIPKASITVTNKSTGASRDVSSDESGRFTVPSLLPGQYDLKISAPGFRVLNRTAEEVTHGHVHDIS